jgi:hypothetical protein
MKSPCCLAYDNLYSYGKILILRIRIQGEVTARSSTMLVPYYNTTRCHNPRRDLELNLYRKYRMLSLIGI